MVVAPSATREGVPASPPLRELRGVVERITYQNPENGYTVARLAAERALEEAGRGVAEARAGYGEDRLTTVVGTLPDLTPGEAIIAHGWWRNDPKHGWQFQAQEYRTALPATLQGMKKYLGSGLVKGIGPVNAGRIVDRFGEGTFEVIDTTPERLTEVAGIGPVRAARIAATWAEQRHIREVMAALQGYGVSTSLAVRIYKRFGDESGRVISKEPYRLAREVWGIGFKTADKIARAVGIAVDAPARLQAGALHALSAAADEGHTLLPRGTLVAQAAELLQANPEAVASAVEALLEAGDLVTTVVDVAARVERSPEHGVVQSPRRSEPAGEPAGKEQGAGGLPPRQRTGGAAETGRSAVGAEESASETQPVALAPFARAESGLAGRLLGLTNAGEWSRALATFGTVDWSAAFGWLAERHGLHLAPEQEAGVRMALASPVSILTGGPGTGKTHTLRAILTLAQAKRLRCLLAAPTGRAAKRMSDATGLPASTLHRLLELRPGANRPEKALQAEIVVVDEVSMLDALLANQLVKAVVPGAHLLLVGDPDQLPSVGAGDVLADLLRSGKLPVTRLTRIFRQGAGSGIAENARRINNGEMPVFGRDVEDCYFLPADDAAAAAQLVVDLVARRLPARYGFGPGEVQVLAPMHRGEAGVGALNLALQERLNPAREGVPEARGGGRAYRPGDRVLQLKNDYDLKVFNGDLGTVREVDAAEQELQVLLDDGREVRYPYASLYALTHAYCVSVHKSQGAEFPAVVIPLLTNHAAMLGRTLLYTAFTRARQLVVLVGQRRALALAVRDWRRAQRHTALDGLLAGSLRYQWPRQDARADQDEELPDWEGLLAAAPEE